MIPKFDEKNITPLERLYNLSLPTLQILIAVCTIVLPLQGGWTLGGHVTQGGAEYRLPWAMMCQPYRLGFALAGRFCPCLRFGL